MDFIKSFAVIIYLAASGSPVIAETVPAPAPTIGTAAVQDLARSMQIGPLMVQLRQEGLDGADKLAEQFQIDASGGFQVQIETLFDPGAMEKVFVSVMQRDLAAEPATLQVAMAFFDSNVGQKAMLAELAARSAMLDDAVEAKARAAYQDLATNGPARMALIDRMVSSGDLIEYNVMGALNSNLAFLRGLASTGAIGELPESEMLAQVWQDEAELRDQSSGWMTAFLTLAYSDLTDDDLQTYLDFTDSAAGKRVNSVMFTAFDELYRGLSEQQGRIVGRLMQGDDI